MLDCHTLGPPFGHVALLWLCSKQYAQCGDSCKWQCFVDFALLGTLGAKRLFGIGEGVCVCMRVCVGGGVCKYMAVRN